MYTTELLNNNLIDFNKLKPILNPDIWLCWQDQNLKFLYDTNFCSSSSSSSPTTTPFISEEDDDDDYFPPIAKKPFLCSYCHRAFSRRHDLQRHSRVHTGIKPYHCPSCQKSFARSDARGRHFQSDPICSSSKEVYKFIKSKEKMKKR